MLVAFAPMAKSISACLLAKVAPRTFLPVVFVFPIGDGCRTARLPAVSCTILSALYYAIAAIAASIVILFPAIFVVGAYAGVCFSKAAAPPFKSFKTVFTTGLT